MSEDSGSKNQLASIQAERLDFNLKEITKDVFDHFKNLAVCAVVYAVGVSVRKYSESLRTGDLADIVKAIGSLDIFLSFLLAVLNSSRFIYATHKLWSEWRTANPRFRKGEHWLSFLRSPMGEGLFFLLYAGVIISNIIVGICSQITKLR